MSRPCTAGGHPAVSTPICTYFTLPSEDPFATDRFRAYLCQRHGRQMLAIAYKAAIDSATELGEPELCYGCGAPTDHLPFVITVYEGEWFARFDAVVCERCAGDAPTSLGEAIEKAEKLPRRDAMRQRASRGPRRS